MPVYDLVVIGSGPAGQRAAVQAAKLGKRVAVIERQRVVGGVSVNTGTVPSKTLREAVLDLSGLRQRALYGDRFTRRPLSAKELLTRVDLVIQREREVVRAQLLRNGIDLYEGDGAFESPSSIAVRHQGRSRSLEPGFVVIAAGPRPGIPPGITV